MVRSLGEYRAACDGLRAGGKRVALVPTLGGLHSGHAALMRYAQAVADSLVVSVFVNPTQFGPGEDYDRYPRDLAKDVEVCAAEGAALVFAPHRSVMYPSGEATRVTVGRLTESLCGRSRPHHFEGVATVVTKLLAATGACRLVMGRKDYQQLSVVRRLVADLLLPVEVLDHATVRDPDGLATSSRNRFLDADERRIALAIPRALATVCRSYAAGERRSSQLQQELTSALAGSALKIDYAELADASDLGAPDALLKEGRAGAFVAGWVSRTRLIDNVLLGVDVEPPGGRPT